MHLKSKVLSKIWRFKLFIFLFPIISIAQFSTSEPLIQLPGINDQVDIQSDWWGEQAKYMTWINYNDNVYSLCVQKIFPNIDTMIIVQTSTNTLYKPSITIDGDGLKLAWSEQNDAFWSLKLTSFDVNIWSEPYTLMADAPDTIKADINNRRAAWSCGGELFFMIFSDSTTTGAQVIDVDGCNNPSINQYGGAYSESIVYEKNMIDSSEIVFASLNSYTGDMTWDFEVFSNGCLNRNPEIGSVDNISFETYKDGQWGISYAPFYSFDYMSEHLDVNANYRHPTQFTFGIPVSGSREDIDDYLLIYDSDSLDGNSEIMALFQGIMSGVESTINISNLPGSDTWPVLTQYGNYDTLYIAVIWQHETETGTEIWWAKAGVDLPQGDIQSELVNPTNFKLHQNYPNPFNPSTKITYNLTKNAEIILNIYDVKGHMIQTICSGFTQAGSYSYKWNGTNNSGLSVPTGIYFARMETSNYSETIKMLYLK